MADLTSKHFFEFFFFFINHLCCISIIGLDNSQFKHSVALKSLGVKVEQSLA